MGKEKKEEETLNGDNENVVGNKAEATRRGKGTGPSCLNKKAFSCHLACRTGFIIYLIFFYSGGISSNYNNNGISIAICIICIPTKPTSCRQGPGRGPFPGGCG